MREGREGEEREKAGRGQNKEEKEAQQGRERGGRGRCFFSAGLEVHGSILMLLEENVHVMLVT
jgi:hypothetical protein